MQISWEKSIWFFDLDDTLISTFEAGVFGFDGVATYMRGRFNEHVGDEYRKRLEEIYQILFVGYKIRSASDWEKIPGGKDAYDALIRRIDAYQPDVIAEHGHAKKWSREVFVKLIADDLGIAIDPQTVHDAADAYWSALTENAIVFPHAIDLLREIRAHKRPIYIATSSDGRLKMNPDGLFVYDPKYSETLKTERIEKMREKGLVYDGLSIGDPEDKPNPEFFLKVMNLASRDLGTELNPAHCIMVGDSFGGDLQTPREKLGFGLVVWMNAVQQGAKWEEDGYLSTNRLSDITGHLTS